MKLKFKSYGLFLAALVVIVLASVLFFRRNSKVVEPPHRDKVLLEDIRTLKDGRGASQYLIYAALVRLANDGDSLAYEEALKRYKDPQPWIRAGAGEALGHFDTPQASTILRKLIEDPDANVRRKTYEGLAKIPNNPERQKILMDAARKPSLEPLEVAWIQTSLVRAAPWEGQQNGLVKEILSKLKDLKPADQMPILQSLVAVLPRDQDIGSYLEQTLKGKPGEELMAFAINTMAISFPNLIKDNLLNFHVHESEGVRVAVVNSISFACPTGFMTVFSNILQNDKSELVLKSALQNLSRFPREKTKSIFLSLKEKWTSKDMKKTWQEAFRELETNKGPDPCPGKD